MNHLYGFLKILHVLNATLGIGLEIFVALHLWDVWQRVVLVNNYSELHQHVQKALTLQFTIILPLLLVQIVTGFWIIGVQEYSWHLFWVHSSLFGLLILIGLWLWVVYQLLVWRTQLSMALQMMPRQDPGFHPMTDQGFSPKKNSDLMKPRLLNFASWMSLGVVVILIGLMASRMQ